MKTSSMTFSGMICYLDDLHLSIEQFKESIEARTYSEDDGKKVRIFQFEYKDDYLKIGFSDGSSMPRNPNVYNFSKQELEENPRDKDQVEPKEYFAIIDFKTSFLWLNNTKKKNLLISHLRSYFRNGHLNIKDIYDEQDFIDTLKSLDGIKISSVGPNLFSGTNTTTKALEDEMYLATRAELTLSYDKTKFIDKIKDKVINVLNQRNSLQNVTISGRDEKNLGMIFNNNMFTRKIEIKSEIDDNGMYLIDNVYTNLINELEKEKKR